jgi:hypothetical protein
MRIGIVSQALPYLPSRGGFRLYGGNLIRHFSRRHEVDLIAMLEPGDAEHVEWPRQYCRSVDTFEPAGRWLTPLNLLSTHLVGHSLRGRLALKRLLDRRAPEWDVVHVEGGYAAGLIPGSLAPPKVLSLHDSWTLRCDEMLRCAQSLSERLFYHALRFHEPRVERLMYPRFDACTVVADRDVEEVRRTVPRARVELIPYGTDSEYFHPVPTTKTRGEMVFHSHLGYAPNIEATLEFANEIFPLIRRQRPDAVFHIVGAQPGPRIRELTSRPGIRLSADLPDLREAVCGAELYVCAIRHGTGLKSKVLEAMAMQLPIVCYPGSTVGIACTPGTDILVAQNPEEFAAHVLNVLENQRLGESLARAGRQLVEEKYSWDSRARDYEALYGELIAARRTRPAAFGLATTPPA